MHIVMKNERKKAIASHNSTASELEKFGFTYTVVNSIFLLLESIKRDDSFI